MICLCVSLHLEGAGLVRAETALPNLSAPLSVFDPGALPENLGAVTDFYDAGPQAPLAFILEEAHSVIEAQKSIRDLILYLETSAGVSLVGVEGAQGPLDPTLLKTFPDRFAGERVFEDYLSKGELSGAELAAISPGSRASFLGVEDWGIYRANHSAFINARRDQPEAERALTQAEEELNGMKKVLRDPALIRLHELREDFYRDKGGLGDLLNFFYSAIQSSSEKDFLRAKAPQLLPLIESVSLPQDDGIQKTVTQLAEELGSRLVGTWNSAEERRFGSLLQNYRTGALDSGSFLLELAAYGAKAGIRPSWTPAMRRLMLTRERLSALRGGGILDQLEAALDAWEDLHAENAEARTWFRNARALRRVRALIRLEMRRSDWDLYAADPAGHRRLLPGAKPPLKAAEDFYRWAVKRDDVFLRKISERASRLGTQRMALSIGGFHSQGVRKGLRRAGFSYAVITPRFFSLEGEAFYESLMRGQFSYRAEGQRSYYDAFLHHAAEQLRRQIPEEEASLRMKVWRDEILRFLAHEGKIDRWEEYGLYLEASANNGGPLGLNAEQQRRLFLRWDEETERFQRETAAVWKRSFDRKLALAARGGGREGGPEQDNGTHVRKSLAEKNPSAQALAAARALAKNPIIAGAPRSALQTPSTPELLRSLRSELRTEAPEEPIRVLDFDRLPEDLWKEIKERLKLKRIASGLTTAVYESELYPGYVLKRKKKYEERSRTIHPAEHSLKELTEISARLASLGLGLEEKRIVIRLPGQEEQNLPLTWQKKTKPLHVILSEGKLGHQEVSKAAIELLKGLWRQGYFDADFRFRNLGLDSSAESLLARPADTQTLRAASSSMSSFLSWFQKFGRTAAPGAVLTEPNPLYTLEEKPIRALLFDHDFVSLMPEAEDPEVIYQWLKARRPEKDGELFLSPGENFVNNFFYFPTESDDAESQRQVLQLEPLRDLIFPATDPEKIRKEINSALNEGKRKAAELKHQRPLAERPSVEDRKAAASIALSGMETSPAILEAIRELAQTIVRVRSTQGQAARPLPGRSELRNDDFPPPALLDEGEGEPLLFSAEEMREKFFDSKRFWEGENAAKFPDLKRLIRHYGKVRGAKKIVSRLAQAWLSGDQSGFKGAAGELFALDGLIRSLEKAYDIEVLGVGLMAGYREIDAFLKIQRKPSIGAASEGFLEDGFYTLEVKTSSEDGDDPRFIRTVMGSQVIHQITETMRLKDAGIPYRGAILGLAGRGAVRALRAEKYDDLETQVPLYSFHAGPMTIIRDTDAETVPAPADQDFEGWWMAKTNIRAFYFEVLLPAFGLSPSLSGESLERRDRALDAIESREKTQMLMARKRMLESKKHLRRLAEEKERRVREALGWVSYFKPVNDPEAAAESRLIEDALFWYFGRLEISVESLRRDLQSSVLVPLGEAPDTASPAARDRGRGWDFLKSAYRNSRKSSAVPPAETPKKPPRQTGAQPVRPDAVRALSEAKGFGDHFAKHPKMQGTLSAQDADYAASIFWIYFTGRHEEGRGITSTRQEIQRDIADQGWPETWKKIVREAERYYGETLKAPPEARSELRLLAQGDVDLDIPADPQVSLEQAAAAGARALGFQNETIASWARRRLERLKRETAQSGRVDVRPWKIDPADVPQVPAGFSLARALLLRWQSVMSAFFPGQQEISRAFYQPASADVQHAKFLLAPGQRQLLLDLLSRHFGRRTVFPENSPLSMDLDFFLDTDESKARDFVRNKVAGGGFSFAYLKSTETRGEVAPVFRLPGIRRVSYTLKSPLSLSNEDLAGGIHILFSETPIHTNPGASKSAGVLVSREDFLNTRLDAPEWSAFVEMILSVESLRRQLPDRYGGVFPELPGRLIRAAFGLLNELMTYEEAQRAFMQSA